MRRFTLLALAIALLAVTRPLQAQSTAIDVIILADTSASVIDDLDRLCAGLPDALKSINAAGLSVQARVIGITDKYRCAQDTIRSLSAGSNVADDEDWGMGIVELAGRATWQPAALRLIIPLSDAGPASGNPVHDPGADRDITTRAIRAASANKIVVSPLLIDSDPDATPDDQARLERLAQELASKTGGRVFISRDPSDLLGGVTQLIVAASEIKAGLTAVAATIPTPAKVSLDPGILLTNATLAVLAVAVLGLTATLFDESFGPLRGRGLPSNRVTRALGSASDRIGAVLSAIATPTSWPIGTPSVRRALTVAVLTAFFALTALVAAFLDPNFQPNTPVGIVTFVTMLVALALVNLAALLGGSMAARAGQVAPGVRVRPGAVLLVVACVAISRSIGFLPGYLIGLPAGLALLAAETNRARDAAIGRAAVFAAVAAGLAAWLLAWPLEALSASLSGSVASGAATLALGIVGGIQSALLTIVLIAVEFALFDLLPIGSTTGRLWFTQQRVVWALAFGGVAFAALHTLFNPNRAGLDALRNSSLLPIGAIIALYSGVTLAAWLLTNEARIREPGKLNRRSALIAAVLIVTWLGGLACVALAEAMNTFSSSTLLIGVAALVVVSLGVWGLNRARAKRVSTPRTPL
ncbi:MAG TPA: hypothetical protein VJG32_23425 [Anaerolineae bacterium]|nr:hypothetical protein [Anaerolineae bacterium]